MITATVDIKGIQNAYSYLQRFVDNDVIDIAATEVKLQIRNLSAMGLDAKGVRFKPYVKPYGRQRVREGFSENPVDLRKTGGLIDNIMTVNDPSGLLALITVDEDHGEIAKGLTKKRNFLDLHPDTVIQVERSLKNGVEKIL